MLSQDLTNSKLAVSAFNRETALNTEQALDLSFIIDKGTLVTEDNKNEQNSNEATGYRGVSRIDRRPAPSGLNIEFSKLKPSEFAFILAYLLGSVTTTAVGVGGHKHVIVPISDDLDGSRSVPSFTLGQQFGAVEKALYASGIVKSGKFTFAKNEFLKASAELTFSGKTTSNYYKDTITAAENATSLTLTLPVNGGSAAARLNSISFVRAEVSEGKWVYCAVSAASGATPGVLTITAPGAGTDLITYEIVYIPTEAAWCTFPTQIEESPLFISDLSVILDGKYNPATGLVEGGKTLAADLNSFEYSCSLDGGEYDYRANGGSRYANSFLHNGWTQGISISRDYCDYILRQAEIDASRFAIQARAVGGIFEAGHNFEMRMVWPRCEVNKAGRAADNGKLKTNADIVPLWGDSSGPVIATVINQAESFAA